jgi:hypothetical protein
VPTPGRHRAQFGDGRNPAQFGGQTAAVRRGRFPPLWVYFFGLFALAFFQRFAFPPDEHSVTFNVVFFAVGAVIVIVVLTIAERVTTRR